MGMRTDIQEALAEAFLDADGLLDVVQTFNFVTTSGTDATASNYDSDSDSYTDAAETLSPSKGVLVDVDSRDVDNGNIKQDDQYLICNAADVLTIPKIDMIVRLADDTELIIKDAGRVPEGAAPAIVYIMLVGKDDERV